MPTRKLSKETSSAGSGVDRSEVEKRVTSKIVRASELPANRRVLIYGRPKSGKTRLAASAPDVLLIDVNEQGTASVRKDYDPNVYPVEYWQEINDVYWYLQGADHPYKSVSIDGITAMQNLCLNFVLGEMQALDASRDPDMPSRQAWGKVGKLMRTQITNFRNLPMNVVFTALTRAAFQGDDDDEDADRQIGPACSPSVAGHLEAAVDVIGYLFKREVFVKVKGSDKKKKVTRRRLLVDGTEKYLVGDRTGALGNQIDAPDLTKMLAIMNDEEE
jgi:hypothetical protein